MADLSPDRLRDVAFALDMLSRVSIRVLELAADMPALGASEAEVTVRLTRAGEPLQPEDARTLLDWIKDDTMQQDLRRWAKELEAWDDHE